MDNPEDILNIVSVVNSMASELEKRIPVSEETWQELGAMKAAGETYDDLLQEMIQEHNRKRLMEKMERVEEMDADDLMKLDDV